MQGGGGSGGSPFKVTLDEDRATALERMRY